MFKVVRVFYDSSRITAAQYQTEAECQAFIDGVILRTEERGGDDWDLRIEPAEWGLFLDDQSNFEGMDNRKVPEGFLFATSSEQAIQMVREKGIPSFIDFDCDLGDGDSAGKFVDYLTDNHYDAQVPDYRVHSENPVEAKNIISKMESWKRSQSL